MKTILISLLAVLAVGCSKPTDFFPKEKDLGFLNGAPDTNQYRESQDPETSPNGGGAGGQSPKPVTVTENFTQAKETNRKLDILWVVDSSGSMHDEQVELGKNFDLFIKNFMQKDIDFKMAITTTDTTPEFRGVMVDGSAEKLNSVAAKKDPELFIKSFNELVKVGTNGSGYEKGLEATEAFTEKHAESFFRKEAYLAVVIISDEEDQSEKSPVEYVQGLKKLKANPGLVKVYSIVDKTLSNPEPSITRGFERYAKASEASASPVLDIRHPFTETLSEISDSIINLLDRFALANKPIDGSLQVFVNGKQTTDYSYESSSQSILFNPGSLPAAGAKIVVKYKNL